MSAPNGSTPNGSKGRDLNTKANATSRPTGQRFGPGMMAGGPAAKALDFKGSSQRLLGMMAPQRGLALGARLRSASSA